MTFAFRRFSIAILTLMMISLLAPMISASDVPGATPVVEPTEVATEPDEDAPATPTEVPADPKEPEEPTKPEVKPNTEPSTPAAQVQSRRMSLTAIEPPQVTANGQTGDLYVPWDTLVSIRAPVGSEFGFYPEAGCTGDVGWSAFEIDLGYAHDKNLSFQARWAGDDSTRGNCVNVTWTSNPILKLSDQTGHIIVPVWTQLSFQYPEGAQTASFNNTTCTDDASTRWVNTQTWAGYGGPITKSYQARWADDDSTRGNCVSVTWVNPPLLTVNGRSGQIIVPLNESVLLQYSAGSEVGQFDSADCSGEPSMWSASLGAAQSTDPVTHSYQARIAGIDSIRSDCVTVTWAASPTLLVDGADQPLTLPVWNAVRFSYPDTAEVAEFPNANCTDDGNISWGKPSGAVAYEPTTYSYAARWIDQPDTVGNCVTVTWESVSVPVLANEICGDNNDEITLPADQMNITVTDSGWSNNTRVIDLTSVNNYVFPPGTVTHFEFTDSGPCTTEPPVPPVVTEVCGPNNDVVTLPDQPTGVLVEDDEVWTDGAWIVTYSAATNYLLPDDFEAILTLTDDQPCPVSPVLPEPATAICGPDNDVVTLPDQPEGVLTEDTGWNGNKRTITFSPDVDFAFPASATSLVEMTDDNIACEVEPIGHTVTITLATSDGGSIEGTGYSVYAPVASQADQPAMTEGLVGPNNEIVLYEMLAGTYRLVLAPDGYEPVDTTFAVTDGSDAQTITIDLTALQIPPTLTPTIVPTQVPPTPTPTAVPTEVPATPAVAPTTAPAPTTAAVSGLPDTGSGTGNDLGTLTLVSLLAAATLGLATLGRRRRA